MTCEAIHFFVLRYNIKTMSSAQKLSVELSSLVEYLICFKYSQEVELIHELYGKRDYITLKLDSL